MAAMAFSIAMRRCNTPKNNRHAAAVTQGPNKEANQLTHRNPLLALHDAVVELLPVGDALRALLPERLEVLLHILDGLLAHLCHLRDHRRSVGAAVLLARADERAEVSPLPVAEPRLDQLLLLLHLILRHVEVRHTLLQLLRLGRVLCFLSVQLR